MGSTFSTTTSWRSSRILSAAACSPRSLMTACECSESTPIILLHPPTLLTTSCTHALELTALLLDLNKGDEVILPAFSFVSTANAFVLRGARPVFADVRPDTLNLDEQKLPHLITRNTRAVVPVHYAGVG